MSNLNIKELAKVKENVVVSIYLPTHRNAPDNRQDRVRYKNLLTQAEKKIKEMDTSINIDQFLNEAEKLYEDIEFWNHTLDGLAVLVRSDNTEIVKLEGAVPEKLIVSERFHLIPLLNYNEFASDKYIINISKDRFKLYFGDREGINEVEMPGVYQKFTDLYDDQDYQNDINLGKGTAAAYHGGKTKSEADEVDTIKYLRYVIKELSKFLKDVKAPIIVFGTTEVTTQFANLVNSDFTITKVIRKPLEALNLKQLYLELKEVLQPSHYEEIDGWIERFRTEIQKEKASEDVGEILKESENGRVEALLTTVNNTALDDKTLDQIVQNTILTDGRIIVIDDEKSEFPENIAAIYRY